jgi:hypothetical protein
MHRIMHNLYTIVGDVECTITADVQSTPMCVDRQRILCESDSPGRPALPRLPAISRIPPCSEMPIKIGRCPRSYSSEPAERHASRAQRHVQVADPLARQFTYESISRPYTITRHQSPHAGLSPRSTHSTRRICPRATTALTTLLDHYALRSNSDDRRALRRLVELRARAMTDWRSSTGIALYTLDHIQVMLQQTSGTAPSVAITQADEGKIATAHNFTRGMGCSEEPDMVGMRPYMMTERCKGSIDVLSRVFRDAPSSQTSPTCLCLVSRLAVAGGRRFQHST